MAKGARDKIKLESTAGTGHFYTTTKKWVVALNSGRMAADVPMAAE